MPDTFLLAAPFLLIPVVALLSFVGCNWFFGLDETELIEPGPGPTGLTASPGNNKVALTWDAYPNTMQYNVKVGEASGVYTTTSLVHGNSHTDRSAQNNKTYFYVVTALPTSPDIESEPSNEVPAMPSASSLIPFVKPVMLGTPATGVPSGFYGMAVAIGSADIEVQTLGRIFLPGNTQIHAVKIVDAVGADIPGAFVSVNMAGGTAGQFVYVQLSSPVTLSAGTTYLVLSQEIQGLDEFYNHDTIVQTTDVAMIPFSARGGPPYVQDGGPNRSYGLVNFQY